jgi:hypothetical protein
VGKAVEIRGPWKYLAVGAVLALVLGNWILPDLLADATGSGGRSYRLLRSGFTEQHKTNVLSDHWITAAKGNWKTWPIPVLSGETLVIEYDVQVDEGWVALRLWEFLFPPFKDINWSTGFHADDQGTLRVPIEESGLYQIRLSYFAFGGDIVLDWRIE